MNGKRKSEADLEGGSTNIILTVGTIPSSNCCRTGGTWSKKYQTNGNVELKQDIINQVNNLNHTFILSNLPQMFVFFMRVPAKL